MEKKVEKKDRYDDSKYYDWYFDENLEKVPIYESEVEIIKKQEDIRLQKLLFVILVWSKFSKWGNVICRDRVIAYLAGVKGIIRDIGIILYPVLAESEWDEGYLLQIYYRSWDEIYYNVLFKEKDKSKTPMFYVNDIKECKKLFPIYFDYGTFCDVCGKLIKNEEDNRLKYCRDCGKEFRKKYIAQKVREHRSKNNM